MSTGKSKTTSGADGLHVSPAFLELFHYAKAGRTRAYHLKSLDDESAELWVVSQAAGKPRTARKLVTFDRVEDADLFLQDIKRELREGGWSEI
jgi:hypothetical protein